MDVVRVGIIGDYDSGKLSHPETDHAIQHASQRLAVQVDIEWVSSDRLAKSGAAERLSGYDGLLAAPGFVSDPDAAVDGIRFARESGKPFAGT